MLDFDVSVSELPDRTTVKLAGELDHATCPRIVRITNTVPLRCRTLRLHL
jgi:hypothetical protein